MNPYLYLAKICSVLSYILSIKFNSFLSVLEMFLYADILIGIFTFIYFLIILKFQKQNIFKTLIKRSDYLTLILLFISIFGSILKSFLLNSFLPSEIGFFDLLIPIGTFIFSLFFFKKEKIQKKHIIAFVFCFIGITIYILSKENVIIAFKLPLVLYFIVKSLSGIGERRLSKERSLKEAFSIDNIVYAIFGIVILFFFQEKNIGNIKLKTFNIKYIFSFQVISVFILANFNHLFTIIAHKKEKLMTGFLVKNISTILINIFLTYLFFNKFISLCQFISIAIIMIGLYIFNKET